MPSRKPDAPRILLFSASLRKESLNGKLAALAAAALQDQGATVDHARFSDFNCPSFDGDREQAEGIPEGSAEMQRRLLASDAFVIASPEYNGAMPGVLKNVIDWTSRFRPQPFHARHALLMSASPSMVGGNRGLWSLRVPLEHLGARVFPDMFSLASAHRALTDQGEIADPKLAERFRATLSAFLDLVEAAKHYPCMKRAWVEFLGEQPGTGLDRVE